MVEDNLFLKYSHKLSNANKVFDFALFDLCNLKNKVKSISVDNNLTIDNLVLEWCAIHVLVVSNLEYILKKCNLINKQSGIITIIQDSTLTNIEKDWLIYFVLVRHTIVHNGNHFGDDFFINFNKHIKMLKLDMRDSKNQLSIFSSQKLYNMINLIQKFLIVNIFPIYLSKEECLELTNATDLVLDQAKLFADEWNK